MKIARKGEDILGWSVPDICSSNWLSDDMMVVAQVAIQVCIIEAGNDQESAPGRDTLQWQCL